MKRFILILLCLIPMPAAQASEIKTGKTVTVDEKTEENLYLLGGDIQVNEVVMGDLIAAGGEIFLRGDLQDDALLCAGELHVDAQCEDDLRALAGELTITHDIQGDLLVAAGEITLAEDVTVHGSVIGAGGEITINGRVLGDIRLRAGEIALNGDVQGRLDLRAGEIRIDGEISNPSTLAAHEIHLGSRAMFRADVAYWCKEDQIDFSDHLADGVEAHYDSQLKTELADMDWERAFKKGFVVWNGFRLLSGLVLTLLFFGLFRGFFARNAGLAKGQTGNMILYGLGLFIGLPLLSAFAFATVVGIPVGIISTAVFVTATTSSNALAAVIGAYEVKARGTDQWSRINPLLLSLGLFVGLRLIGFLPGIGGLLTTVAGAFAIGWIILAIRGKGKNEAEGESGNEELV